MADKNTRTITEMPLNAGKVEVATRRVLHMLVAGALRRTVAKSKRTAKHVSRRHGG